MVQRTAEADEDLIGIWGYIATDNPKAADSLLDEIEDKFILLSEQPRLGPARSENRLLERGRPGAHRAATTGRSRRAAGTRPRRPGRSNPRAVLTSTLRAHCQNFNAAQACRIARA